MAVEVTGPTLVSQQGWFWGEPAHLFKEESCEGGHSIADNQQLETGPLLTISFVT